MNSFLKFGIYTAIILTVGYLGLRSVMYKYIQPNEIGVWMVNGGMNGIPDYSIQYGHFPIDFNPLTKGFTIPAQPWTIDLPARTVLSQQNGEWTVDPAVTFRVDREQAPMVCFRNNNLLKSGDDEKFLQAVGDHLLTITVNDVINDIIGLRKDTFLLTNKILITRMFEDSVRVKFLRNGYVLESFTSGLTPPKDIIETNRAKNLSQQSVYTAQADVIRAKADAEVSIAKADAAAKVKLIEAQAEAQSVKLQEQSLTPLMIQKMWIDSWNGVLPVYITGAQSGMMLGMPKQ